MNVADKKLNFDTYEIIFYEQPNPKRLQFLALNPLELDISSTDMNITKKKKPLNQKQLEELSNLKKIIEYAHILNNEKKSVSDDLGIVLVQVYIYKSKYKFKIYLYTSIRLIRLIFWNMVLNYWPTTISVKMLQNTQH